MKRIDYKKVGEVLYEETLTNGLKVVYYPTEKSKNFYISVSTNYGANVNKYTINNKEIEIIPGSAHFLEHRIMDFSKNEKAMNELLGLGSIPNAYTMYDITNYNMIGSVDIKKNITLLLNRVFKPTIKEEDIKSEIGIISEEIDMQNDNINYILMSKIFENAFITDKSIATPILGTKSSISEITEKYLKKIYKDFYTFDKMHIVVVGNFNLKEVSNHINKYFENKKENKKNIKIINKKEPKEVKEKYIEIKREISEPKTGILFKIPIEKVGNINPKKYNRYLGLIVECLFGNTSDIKEEFKINNLTKFSYYMIKAGKYNMLELSASGEKTDMFINLILKQVKNIKITKRDFETKIKVAISTLILNFEDIIEVENMITNQIKTNGKIVKNERKELESLNYSELKEIIKSLNFDSYTVLKIKE